MIYWVVHICIIGGISYLVFRKFHAGIHVYVYSSALIIKLIAGITVGLIFFNYYGQGDTIDFFTKSKSIAALPWRDYLVKLASPSNYSTSGQPRVLFFTKILSFFTFITGESYWLSSMYLSLISFFATWYLVTVFVRLSPQYKPVVIGCFLYIPTIVFWSSGILKDSLAFGALLFAIAATVKLYYLRKISISEFLIFGNSLFVLLKVKHYLLITYILFVGILLFLKLISQASLFSRVVAVIVIAVAIGTTQYVHPYLRFNRIALTLYENNQTIYENSDPENRLDLFLHAPTVAEIVKSTPSAIQIGLFRPSIFDKSTIWGWFHRIENTILAFLFAFSFILYFKLKPKLDTPMINAAAVAILLLATMLALSTPNFGTLVRYKNAFLPFLFMLSSALPYQYLASNWKSK